MKTWIIAVVVACAALIANTLLFSQDAASQNVKKGHPPLLSADVVPVLRFSRCDKIEVEYDFVNKTNKGFRYLKGWPGQEIYNLGFLLTKNGRVIRRLEMTEGPPAVEANIGTLKPGGRIRWRVDLNRRFGHLAPGQYELAVSYIWPYEKTIRLTPVNLKKTLVTIIIR